MLLRCGWAPESARDPVRIVVELPFANQIWLAGKSPEGEGLWLRNSSINGSFSSARLKKP